MLQLLASQEVMFLDVFVCLFVSLFVNTQKEKNKSLRFLCLYIGPDQRQYGLNFAKDPDDILDTKPLNF